MIDPLLYAVTLATQVATLIGLYAALWCGWTWEP